MPLDELLDVRPDELSDDALVAFIQRCATLRSSAQTRHATLRKESVEVHGAAPKKTKKGSGGVNAALALLMKKGGAA